MSERLFIVIMDFVVFGIKWTLIQLNLHKKLPHVLEEVECLSITRQNN